MLQTHSQQCKGNKIFFYHWGYRLNRSTRLRHRAFGNFISNTLAAIATYFFFPKKPSIRFGKEAMAVLTTKQ